MKTLKCDFSGESLAPPVRLAALALFMLAVPGLAAAQGAAAAKTTDAATDTAADDEMDSDVKALVCPTNYLEAGILNASNGSTKFGEYNGINESGLYGIGNFNVQGGSGFCQKGGNLRWQVTGRDLGTTSRSAGASIEAQGKWSFGVNFDQLRHYTTTGYESPFQGSQGGNVFFLPPSFGVINKNSAAAGQPAGSQGGTQGLTASQLAAFNKHDVYNQRLNTSLTSGYQIDDNWSVKFDYNHLDMSGAKLISSATEAVTLNGLNYANQGINVLMNPTESTTDNFNVALNWVGQKGYASAEYYLSVYRDDFSGLSWSNPLVTGTTPAGPASTPHTGAVPTGNFPVDTMSTPPDNQFQQLKVTGGYIFSTDTKVVGSASVALNTQDDSFAGTYTPGSMISLPAQSLDGQVIIWHADGRLTHQFTNKLGLNVGFTYNERDNNTSSNTYTFVDIGGRNRTVVNTPMSLRKADVDAGLDYRFDSAQHLHLGYEFEEINRWCKNALANNATGASAPGGYYVDSSCVQSPDSAENRLVAKYNLNLLDSVSFNAGYTYADRRATINQAFYNPIEAAGMEDFGFVAFYQASRRENLFKAGVNWQVTNAFSVGVDGRYTRDDYYDHVFGVQSGNSSSINLDAEYDLSENYSFGAYASWQNNSYSMLNTKGAASNPGLPGALPGNEANEWGNSLADHDVAFGVDGKQKLLNGKLRFNEDVSYSLGRSTYTTTNVNLPAQAAGTFGSPPDITSNLLQVRLAGSYQLNKASTVSAGYIYQRLISNDYFYNAYAFGFTPTSLTPSNQVSPNYTENIVFVTYRYSFL
ncbi:MtrB/PioB family decaheme-associated outer membrane protein [Paraburkholderia sp.]|uniref:MtrB/PioB family decaheme-associated outer membrane protein n=1 Tax=Paraburkholderia sp. TaxID=1926495 RepID=UPI0025DCAD3D|nr:MtrB/PioB family decaheme-associated outer membrane protein [Paraburkholderia sp.]